MCLFKPSWPLPLCLQRADGRVSNATEAMKKFFFLSVLFREGTSVCECRFCVCVKQSAWAVFTRLWMPEALYVSGHSLENVWLQACGLWPSYFICIMRQCWLNFQCTPWLVPLQYVINVGFFHRFPHFLSSQGASVWMNQTLCLFQSPRCFIYRVKSTLTPLHSLWKIYQALARLSRRLA